MTIKETGEFVNYETTIHHHNTHLFIHQISTSRFKNSLDLNNGATGDVLEHHAVAGFVGGLSSRSRSSDELLFELVLVQDGEVSHVLFTGCKNARQSGWKRPEQRGDPARSSPHDPAGHAAHAAEERGGQPPHLLR